VQLHLHPTNSCKCARAHTYKHPPTHKLSTPTCSGQTELLGRCAAGADLAPDNEHCILVCGGYGMRNPGNENFDYFNDLVRIDTSRWVMHKVKA